MSEINTSFKSCFSAKIFKSGSLAIDPSLSLTISHSTPAGPQPAILERSIAASVCPVRFSTPPSLYRRGNTCPGRTKSSADASGDPSWAIVCARSPADIPVVAVFKSTDTVNAVRIASSFSLLLTIKGKFSLSAVSFSTETHTRPLEWRIIKCIDSCVILSAAPIKSPSFSRSSSSSTTTNLPAATSSNALSIEANPGVGSSGSKSATSASGCHDGTLHGRSACLERVIDVDTEGTTLWAWKPAEVGPPGPLAKHVTHELARRGATLPGLACTTAASAEFIVKADISRWALRAVQSLNPPTWRVSYDARVTSKARVDRAYKRACAGRFAFRRRSATVRVETRCAGEVRGREVEPAAHAFGRLSTF